MSGTHRYRSTRSWLPKGRIGAVCFSIDDVHPGTSADAYEAGGDCERDALGHLQALLEAHRDLRATLFVTADWRCLSPLPTRELLGRIPWLRDRFYLTAIRPRHTMRVSRHPAFAKYLRSLPRTEVAFHGLDHVSRGVPVSSEFRLLNARACRRRLLACRKTFEEAGLEPVPGLSPPGWEAPPSLIEAMCAEGLSFLASARDLTTPVAPDARTRHSGWRGVSLIHPETVAEGRLLHFTANFQATSDDERALGIVEHGGLLHIKAHVVEQAFGYRALDALNSRYRDRLDHLFERLTRTFGDSLWWTSMGEIAERWPRED